jgi:hypothetical protein
MMVAGSIAGKTCPFHLYFDSVGDILCLKELERECHRIHNYCIEKSFDNLEAMFTWRDFVVYTLRKEHKEWMKKNGNYPSEIPKEMRVGHLPFIEDFVIYE